MLGLESVDYFYQDELYDEYKSENSGWEKAPKQKLAPRMKYTHDLFSFFICYKCVDLFMYNCMVLFIGDMTRAVLSGLLGRKLHEQCNQLLVGN